MKLWITETEKVKRQAEEEAVVILQHWRQKVRRLRLYRACLCAVLILACLGLMGYSYYLVDSSIPSVIHVRAESEESLELSIPARGEIVNVSRQGNSNIPDGAVTIDLSRPLTLKTGNADNLQMQVKLFGILPFILSSIYGTLGAAIIGVPIGLLTAVFLSKAADPKLRTVVVTAIELLSGIPSVVFGLLGMQVLVPAVAKTFGKASGACLLSAIVVLSIMILPSIVSVSVTALNAVPPEYEQGSLALGATDTETWFKISIPAAKSGIAAGIVLGIGRAIGEAMAVMMVAGNSPNMPDSPFRSVTFLTTAIAKEMSYAGGLQRQALFSIALVLFVFIMIINVVLNVVLKGGSRDE